MSYPTLMMHNFQTFRENPIIPLRRSPQPTALLFLPEKGNRGTSLIRVELPSFQRSRRKGRGAKYPHAVTQIWP